VGGDVGGAGLVVGASVIQCVPHPHFFSRMFCKGLQNTSGIILGKCAICPHVNTPKSVYTRRSLWIGNDPSEQILQSFSAASYSASVEQHALAYWS